MVLQGHDTTLPVTLADMAYHTQCVARGSKPQLPVADMPFGSYQESPQQAFRSAAELMAAGAQMVKLAGARRSSPTPYDFSPGAAFRCADIRPHAAIGAPVRRLPRAGQGEDAEQKLIEDAWSSRRRGRDCWCSRRYLRGWASGSPSACTSDDRHRRRPGCSGQVLVLHDMLDVFPGKKARFVRNFMKGASVSPTRRTLRARRQGRQLSRRRTQFLGPAVDIVTSVRDLRERLQREPDNVFVPTMGKSARGPHPADAPREASRGVHRRRIFVTGSSFGPKEDFEALPAHPAGRCGNDEGRGRGRRVRADRARDLREPPDLRGGASDLQHILEGAFPPGHFRGVAPSCSSSSTWSPAHRDFRKKDYSSTWCCATW